MVGVNGSLSNITNSYEDDKKWTLFVGVGVCVLIMFLTSLGNLLVCFAVLIYKNLQTRTNLMLLSLAVSDLLMVVSMAFNTTMIQHGDWIFSASMCTAVSSLALTLCFISILHLCLLSIDRYISVKKPLRHQQLMTTRTIVVLMVAIWLVPAVVVNLPYADFDFRASVFGCLRKTSLHSPSSSFALVLFFVILPFALIFYVYIYLFKVVRRHARRITAVQTNIQLSHAEERRLILKREVKTIKTFALVIGAFLLCYTPFFLLGCYASSKGTGTIPSDVMSVVTWLAFCNSFCNPVVYSLRYKNFRESFRKILCFPQSIVTSERTDSVSRVASVGISNVSMADAPPYVVRTQPLPPLKINSALTK